MVAPVESVLLNVPMAVIARTPTIASVVLILTPVAFVYRAALLSRIQIRIKIVHLATKNVLVVKTFKTFSVKQLF